MCLKSLQILMVLMAFLKFVRSPSIDIHRERLAKKADSNLLMTLYIMLAVAGVLIAIAIVLVIYYRYCKKSRGEKKTSLKLTGEEEAPSLPPPPPPPQGQTAPPKDEAVKPLVGEETTKRKCYSSYKAKVDQILHKTEVTTDNKQKAEAVPQKDKTPPKPKTDKPKEKKSEETEKSDEDKHRDKHKKKKNTKKSPKKKPKKTPKKKESEEESEEKVNIKLKESEVGKRTQQIKQLLQEEKPNEQKKKEYLEQQKTKPEPKPKSEPKPESNTGSVQPTTDSTFGAAPTRYSNVDSKINKLMPSTKEY